MLTRTHSAGIIGVEGRIVTVEADVTLGLPGLTIVGQAKGALHEARERVRSALSHCGHPIRSRKQIVNLAPADLRKDSPGVDLAVACALLASHEIVPAKRTGRMMLWGELALDGQVRPVAGALVVADTARQAGIESLVVARASASEAALIPGLAVLAVDSLPQLVAHLRGERLIEPHRPERPPPTSPLEFDVDLADIRGLTVARRALEVMVAGGHNLLVHGSPGVGKTMLARRAATLLPDLDREAALEVTKIHGLARGRRGGALIERPPVRMPHHTVSPAGLLGGGHPPRPGEVSLAHRGLLFLDELPEFPRACIEGLREPLEDGEVNIVRANHTLRFPARFQLMAAMNPCPCGYAGHPDRACVCPVRAVARYQRKLSGPFMDRLDLIVPVAPVPTKALTHGPPGESSEVVRARIQRARALQRARLSPHGLRTNAEVPARDAIMESVCRLTDDARRLLEALARQRGLSPRAIHRLRRVARTIADLARAEERAGDGIEAAHVAEAAQMRSPPEMDAERSGQVMGRGGRPVDHPPALEADN